MATAIEASVVHDLKLETTNPWDPGTDLANQNPIGKIPALILPDGSVLFDSPVICEYLDSLREPPRLFPPEGPLRWQAVTRMALADGLMDAAILRRRELMRNDGEQSAWWVERQFGIVTRAMGTMEAEAKFYTGIDIGLLTTAISLGYLDFRLPEFDWRGTHPRLAAWYLEISARPSLRETAPRE